MATDILERAAPSANGVVRLTRRGLAKFQFGDAEPVVTLDVIEVFDQWREVDWQLRVLEGEFYVVPVGKTNEHAVNRLNFVQSVVNDAYARLGTNPPAPVPQVTRFEAEAFVAAISAEAQALRNFISPSAEKPSSAPESTAEGTPTNFSQ